LGLVYLRQRFVPHDDSAGTKVLGKVHPFPGNDFSSFLLQAKASKWNYRARERWRRHHQLHQAGIRIRHRAGGQKLAGLLIFITDIHALGLKTAPFFNSRSEHLAAFSAT
jgi:branched-chain amino acid transport system substrate-binding protein